MLWLRSCYHTFYLYTINEFQALLQLHFSSVCINWPLEYTGWLDWTCSRIVLIPNEIKFFSWNIFTFQEKPYLKNYFFKKDNLWPTIQIHSNNNISKCVLPYKVIHSLKKIVGFLLRTQLVKPPYIHLKFN